MKTYKASELHKITRRTNIRDYAYTVWVTKKTGRVVKLRAGCRRWSSFRAAVDHYASDVVNWLGRPARWHDDYVNGDAMMLLHRTEARAILQRLGEDVAAYGRKIAAAKRKARRAKK